VLEGDQDNSSVDGSQVFDDVIPSTKTSSNTAWQSVEAQSFNFAIPENWYLEVIEPKEKAPNDANFILLIQDTPAEVRMGALVVEDCEDMDSSNCQYAPDYTAIQIFVYEGEADSATLSWTDFFASYYPEVQEFESLALTSMEEIDAVRVSKVDGPWLGLRRVFVRSGDRFFDLSLHSTHENTRVVEDIFWNFVVNFNFGGKK